MSFSSTPQKELVVFYAEWCSHCQNLIGPNKVWSQLETAYAGDSTVVIKKISTVELEAMTWSQKQKYRLPGQSEFKLEAYPTIILVDGYTVHNYQVRDLSILSVSLPSRSLKSLQLFLAAPDYYAKLMELKSIVMRGGTEFTPWGLDMKMASRAIYGHFDL